MCTNVYISIDPAWSNNYFEALSEHIDGLDYSLINTSFECMSHYLVLQHNFLIDRQASIFNKGLEAIRMRLGNYPIPVGCHEYYYNTLFRHHQLMFSMVDKVIKQITPNIDDMGIVHGLVLTTDI